MSNDFEVRVAEMIERLEGVETTLKTIAQDVGTLRDNFIQNNAFDEYVRDDVGQAEGYKLRTLDNFDLFTLNKKALFADEKDIALKEKMVDLELKRLEVARQSQALAHQAKLNNAEIISMGDERVHKASVLSDERKYGNAKWTQEVRHADIAIENQWGDAESS